MKRNGKDETMAQMRSFLGGSEPPLELDFSDVYERMIELGKAMSKTQFERLVYRTVRETGKRGQTIIAREVQKQYTVKQDWAKKQIKSPKITWGGSDIECRIPMSGHKGTIGGTYRITSRSGERFRAKILKRGTSRLPTVFPNQGGNKPFVGPNGVLFTRKYKWYRKGIVRVVALALPQMPLNQSEDNTREAFLALMSKRLDSNFKDILARFK